MKRVLLFCVIASLLAGCEGYQFSGSISGTDSKGQSVAVGGSVTRLPRSYSK